MYGIFTYIWAIFGANVGKNIPAPWSIWVCYEQKTPSFSGQPMSIVAPLAPSPPGGSWLHQRPSPLRWARERRLRGSQWFFPPNPPEQIRELRRGCRADIDETKKWEKHDLDYIAYIYIYIWSYDGYRPRRGSPPQLEGVTPIVHHSAVEIIPYASSFSEFSQRSAQVRLCPGPQSSCLPSPEQPEILQPDLCLKNVNPQNFGPPTKNRDKPTISCPKTSKNIMSSTSKVAWKVKFSPPLPP